LIGADGPKSRVARELGLGENHKFLFGVEYEYAGCRLADPDFLHCFIDRQLAPRYIGWIVGRVNVVQVGLARRLGANEGAKEAMTAFLEKIAPVFDARRLTPTNIRAGLIPCGGVVRPVSAKRSLLVGDAAGMVSPVTAGGVHTAVKHGEAAGQAVAQFARGACEDPARWLAAGYPSFRVKKSLRWLYDHCQTDIALNLLLSSAPMRALAQLVFFHRLRAFPAASIAAPRGAR
jgi:digeranylgeranylglycerophospholipid reductase